MKGLRLAGTTALFLFGAIGVAYGQSITYMVNCVEGQKVSDAISRGDAKKPLVIVVRGTCEESITIARDDVTLRGDPTNGGGLHGPTPDVDTVVVSGDRVTLSQLTVTGGSIGVRLQDGYNLAMDQVTIRDTGGRGVLVRSGTLTLTNSTIERATSVGLYLTRGAAARLQSVQILENGNAGIDVDANSTLTIGSSTIRSNASAGAHFDTGAHGAFNNTAVESNGTDSSLPGSGIRANGARLEINAGNVIAHNREHGILAEVGATLGLRDSTISDNGMSGVMGYLGANLVLHGDNTIARNGEYGVYCRVHCTAQLGGATIENNNVDGIAILLGSALVLEAPVTQSNGNGGWGLWCGDAESSVDGLDNLTGTVFEGCTGFGATKVIAGLIYKSGAPSVVSHGFTSEKIDIGTYQIHFPAGTFAAFPMITVTPATRIPGLDTPFAIARLEVINYSPEDGSAVATVRLSSTSPAVTPVDHGFTFIAAETMPAP